jgi:arabinofuranosyltransferase
MDVTFLVTMLLWAVVGAGLIATWPRLALSIRAQQCALVAILVFALAHMVMYGVVAEDAYINLRYSAQLADGHGLVFNQGERVEGYSNFLWVLIVALPKLVFPGVDLVTVASILGVGCALAAIVLTYQLVRKVAGSGPAGLLAALVVAASGSFAGYGPSGLETPLFTLLVLGTLLAVWRRRALLAGVLVALATMTRPDGAVLAVVIGAWLVWWAARGGLRWRAPVLYVAAALALVAPWTVWRLAYYGYLIPNAMAAKSGVSPLVLFGSGWDYLLGWVTTTQALLLLVPVAVFALAARRGHAHPGGPSFVGPFARLWRMATTRTAAADVHASAEEVPRGAPPVHSHSRSVEPRQPGPAMTVDVAIARSTVWLLLALAGTHIAFFVAAGGDWMPGWRFFAPAVPLIAAAVAASWAVVDRGPALPRPAAVLAVSLALVSLVVSATHPKMRPAFLAWGAGIQNLADTGRWLDHSLPRDAVLSTFANGALSYSTSDTRMVVDQLGLTDEHIARHGHRVPQAVVGHQAYDFDYLVNVRRPDVLVTDGRGFIDQQVCVPAPAYAEHYQLANFQVDGGRRWTFVYLRRDRAEQLLAALRTDPGFHYVAC